MTNTRPAARGAARRLVPTLLLLLGAAACESTSAPEGAVALDTQAALQDYATLERMFASDGWVGFRALKGRTPMSRTSGLQATAQLETLAQPASARSFAASLVREMVAARADGAPSAIRVISTEARGRTFVYDAAVDDYRPDLTRPGAPANGVRFILYAVDAANRPIVSQEIGYADLLDEGPIVGDEVALRLVAVERGQTVLDYRTRVTQLGEGVGRLDVDGFVVDGADRLTFTIGVAGEDVGGITELALDFSLRLDARGFAVTGAVRGVEGVDDGDGDIDLTVRHGTQTLRVDAAYTSGTVDGKILLNDRLFVTLSGPQADPMVRGASGSELTGAELLVVLRVIDVVDDVFDLVEDLLQPVDNLIVLGWIL